MAKSVSKKKPTPNQGKSSKKTGLSKKEYAFASAKPSKQKQPFANTQSSKQKQPFASTKSSKQKQPFASTKSSKQKQPFASTKSSEQKQPFASTKSSEQKQPFASTKSSEQKQPFASTKSSEQKQPFAKDRPSKQRHSPTKAKPSSQKPSLTRSASPRQPKVSEKETKHSFYSPSKLPSKQRRRTALLEGACGQAGRVMICGQVVDLLIQFEDIEEKWQPFVNMSNFATQHIRPIHDLMMRTVRRARLRLAVLDIAPRDFDLEKAAEYTTIFTSSEFNTEEDGTFAFTLPSFVKDGNYVVSTTLVAIKSVRQNLKDLRYLREENPQILKKDIVIGYGRLQVLPADYQQLIFISDIDKTFVDTELETKRGLLATLLQKPRQRQVIKGMPQLYQQLTSSETSLPPLLFISGSPEFFRRSLTSLFQDHDVQFIRLCLKSYGDTFDLLSSQLWNLFVKPLQSLTAYKQSLLSLLGEVVQSLRVGIMGLFVHISYKLEVLLKNRLMQPTQAKEVLLGDNTESDYFIFSLYQLLLQAKFREKDLQTQLLQLQFQGYEFLHVKSAARISQLVKQNITVHGNVNPVRSVWINNSKPSMSEQFMHELIISSLFSGDKEAYERASDLVKPRLCQGSLGMALAAFDESLLSIEGVKAVSHSIKEQQDVKVGDENRKTSTTITKSHLATQTQPKLGNANTV